MAFDQKVSDDEFAKAFDDDDDRGVSLGKESLLGGLGSHCHVSFVRREGGARRGAPESRRRLTSEARALLAMVARQQLSTIDRRPTLFFNTAQAGKKLPAPCTYSPAHCLFPGRGKESLRASGRRKFE